MVKRPKYHSSFIIILSICQWLAGQNCDYASMKELLQESTSLITQSNSLDDDLHKMKDDLEERMKTCAKQKFSGKDSLEFDYLDHLFDICKLLADLEGQVDYLQRIREHLQRTGEDRENYNDIDGDIKHIEQNYGSLRIRFEGETLKEMATLKTKDGAEVTIDILPPVNAWEKKDKAIRDERLKRLGYIREYGFKGEQKVFFDSYDSEEEYFFCEIPYVPYLNVTKRTDNWYAITFDKKKRYRTNFRRPESGESTPPLEIKPEANWILERSTPDKWVKFSSKQRLKFEDKQTSAKLSPSEYIKIINNNNIVDYYVPSDRNIDIVIMEKGRGLWILDNILTGGLIITLIYYVYTGVS